MLNLRRRRTSARLAVASASVDRADLRIRNLLDDPQLRRAMGLDAPTVELQQPRLDRRRLLGGPRREPTAANAA